MSHYPSSLSYFAYNRHLYFNKTRESCHIFFPLHQCAVLLLKVPIMYIDVKGSKVINY